LAVISGMSGEIRTASIQVFSKKSFVSEDKIAVIEQKKSWEVRCSSLYYVLERSLGEFLRR
jgi:hypothetical protein